MLLLNPFWFLLRTKGRGGNACTWLLPCWAPSTPASGGDSGWRNTGENQILQRWNNGPCHTARKRANQQLKPALPDSLLAVLPGASFPDALFPCSLPTVLRVLGIISVQQCPQWCEWQLYLPWSPSPTETKTREKEPTLSTLSAPHSAATLLSLPFQQSSWKGLPSLCSLCCTPALAPHPPCFRLHLSTVEGLQIPLSSQNVLHNFQLLNSLTFENVQCWPVVPSWNPLLPHKQ